MNFEEIHGRVHAAKVGDDDTTKLAKKIHRWFLDRVCGSEENLGNRWAAEIKELTEILKKELNP